MNVNRLALLGLLAASVIGSCYAFSAMAGDSDQVEREDLTLLNPLPDAVKATILTELVREVKQLELDEVESETRDGLVIYEVEIELEELELELEITAEGQLISAEVEIEVEDDQEEEEEDESRDKDDA